MKEKINKDFLEAFKAKETFKKNFLGLIKGEIQNEELRTGKEADVEAILRKMEKSLKATNDDEAKLQLEILTPYLPKLMSREEINKILAGYKKTMTGTPEQKMVADLMRLFNSEYKGKADNKNSDGSHQTIDLMEIDNLDLLLPFIQPQSEDDFYYLQILQRKKENPHLGRNSRVIKNYYIKSQDELLEKYDEIKDLCRLFNARASLRLNKRSFEKVAFKSLENLAHNMSQRDFMNISHGYDRAVGLGHNEKKGDSKWILDIDDVTADDESIIEMIKVIEDSLPHVPQSKILALVPSKTGIHIITIPFDSREFDRIFPGIDKHKDNPCNLFIP